MWPARKCWGSEEQLTKQNIGTVISQELVIAALNIQPARVLFDPLQENTVYFTTQFLFFERGKFSL